MSIVVQFGRQLAGRGCQAGGAPVEEQLGGVKVANDGVLLTLGQKHCSARFTCYKHSYKVANTFRNSIDDLV